MKLPKFISTNLQSVSSQFRNPKPNSLLYNRFVLYFVFAISLFQLYTFSVAGKVAHIAMFLLVAFITSFFSKNMTVVMFIALVFTEIIRGGMGDPRFEGMVEGAESSEKPKEEVTGEPSKNSEQKDESAKQPDDETKNKPKEQFDSNDTSGNKSQTPEQLKKTQEELKENQDKIIQGFQEIEPYMNKAESLVAKINDAYTKK